MKLLSEHTENCPYIESQQISLLCNEIISLRSEIVGLQHDTCALKKRIGDVRAWIKTGLLIFFILSTLIVIGQYLFTAQISALGVDIESVDIQLREHIKQFRKDE